MRLFGDMQEPASRRRLAATRPHWSWAESLAVARPGMRYRVTEIIYSLVRDRCEELGINRGDEISCLELHGRALELERTDGRRVVLERDYAWFVQVDPVEPSEPVGGDVSLPS